MANVLQHVGSTSTCTRIRPGVLLKSPRKTSHEAANKQTALAFSVEPLVLERLGSHPRIVEYLGRQDKGLLLGEASHGNLQHYINANNPSIDLSLRKQWCYQSIDALAHVHSRGVIHSDLRPENFLVHERNGSLDLLLCDFGGAVCNELDLDGNQLPNDPFYDPLQGVEITTALDIFSLGSVLYTILTGHWPYRAQPYFSDDDTYLDYVDRVDSLFRKRKYPDVTGLFVGEILMGCWTKEYTTAEQVLKAFEQMKMGGSLDNLRYWDLSQEGKCVKVLIDEHECFVDSNAPFYYDAADTIGHRVFRRRSYWSIER